MENLANPWGVINSFLFGNVVEPADADLPLIARTDFAVAGAAGYREPGQQHAEQHHDRDDRDQQFQQ